MDTGIRKVARHAWGQLVPSLPGHNMVCFTTAAIPRVAHDEANLLAQHSKQLRWHHKRARTARGQAIHPVH